ncbi:MAG: hypothetical protein ACYC2P_08835 [Paludibacteraceae bacterium]
MKTTKENLSKSVLSFKNACEQSGQNGLTSCGIASVLRKTLSENQKFWLAWDLINGLENLDFEKIKILSNVFGEKIQDQMDNLSNSEPDYIKGSLLSRKTDYLRIFLNNINN